MSESAEPKNSEFILCLVNHCFMFNDLSFVKVHIRVILVRTKEFRSYKSLFMFLFLTASRVKRFKTYRIVLCILVSTCVLRKPVILIKIDESSDSV